MREFSLHFYTNTPCNVFVNGEMIGFIDNKDNFFIDIVSFSEQLIISCEPICEDNILYLPCSFRLNYVGNNLICSSNNIEIVPFPNHNFDIILDCKLMMVNSKSTLLSKKIDGYTILTMVDTISTISIFLDDKNLYTCKYAQLSNLEYERTKDLILVKGNSNNNVFFLAFNTTDNKVILSGTYNSIEKTKDNIKVLKSENKTLLTATVYSLNLSNNEVEKYNVYLNDYHETKQTSLIPYSFLEAIKDSNYNLAICMLDNNFIKADKDKLNGYFGKIEKIYYNCYNQNKNAVNYTIYNGKYSNYNFYINNSKIIEIEEIELI